jgi:type IX secretion system PorP/SprF family membrane protein
MRIKSILILLFVFVLGNTKAQNIVDEFELPLQSFLKYNTTVINPGLSIFNTKKTEILAFYRNQSSGLSDAPKTYLLNFNSNNYKKSGYGLSVYQKTVGVYKSFGAIANYGKGINLSDENILSIGFNIIAFNTDLNSNLIKLGQENDPIFQTFEKTNSIIVNPGVSLQLSRVNFGVTVPNLFDYNFRIKKQTTDFANKTFVSHLKYETAKNESDNLFENANLSITAIAKYRKNTDLEYTGGLVYNAPKIGWLQGSYNNIYGVSAGAGINVSSKIAVGYAYEKNIINKLTDIGATHDLFLTFNFGDSEEEVKAAPKKKSDNSTKTMEQEEIQRYKKKVYTKDIVEEELKTKQKLEEFIANAEQENISYLMLPEKNTGIKKGYYLVSKVLISSTIAEKKTADQKGAGLRKSGFFTTASGDWNYVYLERFDKVEDAKKAYQSNYNNKYKDPIWILPIL